jgi:hypothetical protein
MFEPNNALAPFYEPEVILRVSHWPQTWGWYFLFAAGLIWGLIKIRAQLDRWWRNRYRREALSRLQVIASLPCDKRIQAGHELLKIVSVYVYGREVTATIADADWYDLLNAALDEPVFTPERQRSISNALYRAQELSEAEVTAYLTAVEYWLKMHSVERTHD